MNKPADVDDALLLKRIAGRNRLALSALYDRYARIIYGLAFKSLRSVEESEEVVLDVFAQIWSIAERYDVQKGRADTWIFTLARSRIIDRLRKIQRINPSRNLSIDTIEIQLQANDVDLLKKRLLKSVDRLVIAAMTNLHPLSKDYNRTSILSRINPEPNCSRNWISFGNCQNPYTLRIE
ncbi:MAG: RNA polymerase [Hydrococcus sp. SU_1_0]|nr:RNA polymerase [Hydrococcus sp. SU_1_0]